MCNFAFYLENGILLLHFFKLYVIIIKNADFTNSMRVSREVLTKITTNFTCGY